MPHDDKLPLIGQQNQGVQISPVHGRGTIIEAGGHSQGYSGQVKREVSLGSQIVEFDLFPSL